MADTAADRPDADRLVTAGGDPELDARLSAALDTYNFAASGMNALPQDFTVKAEGEAGDLLAGLSGWTWGTCAGIEMVWVREDSRKAGWGALMLEAAENLARDRGCHQVLVSSFTFQAPSFYERHGYTEFGRSENLPAEGAADVHFVKRLH